MKPLSNPLQMQISGKKRLIIIGEGLISQLPFEALITEKQSDTFRSDRIGELPFLIKQYEVLYHYSSYLFTQARLIQHQGKNAENNFAGFVPVFDGKSNNITGLAETWKKNLAA